MDETRLIGWLCFYRMQMCEEEISVSMPTVVRDAFLERGWIDDGDNLTDAGLNVTDLNAAEWGIDPLELEVE